jgi:hypothetical protein
LIDDDKLRSSLMTNLQFLIEFLGIAANVEGVGCDG